MTACPDELALARAGGEDAALAAHVATCARCRSDQERTARAIALLRGRDVPMPSAARREEVRTAILARQGTAPAPVAVEGRSRRRLWIGGAALGLAATVVAVVLARPSPALPGHVHATIRPYPGAAYAVATATPDESVMLQDGSIEVEVSPLHRGERFRVILVDAEVEVHGTVFVATARAGRLVAVAVTHGVVEVRASGAPPRRLAAGESWATPVAAPIAPPVAKAVESPVAAPVAAAIEAAPPPPLSDRRSVEGPRVPVRRPRASAPVPVPSPVPSPSPPAPRLAHEAAYDDAWAAMRSGRFADAARAFSRVRALDPAGRLAEDASYWHAVALERAGQSPAAATAFRDFLAGFPSSPRLGEASVMLGWILVSASEPVEAAQRFTAAAADPRPAVRASASAGLAAVARMRAPAR